VPLPTLQFVSSSEAGGHPRLRKPNVTKPQRRLARLARVFNENVMGLLALVALATALGPMAFDVSPGVERALTVVEWVLVGIFAAEFVISGWVAPDFRKWIRSPWRAVDAATILGPVAALLPQVSDAVGGALALRALRVGRAVAFGARAGTAAAGKLNHEVRERDGVPAYYVLMEGSPRPVDADWDSFVAWTRQPGPSSLAHGTNVDRSQFRSLALSAGLSERELERLLTEEGQGKVRQGAHCAAVVLQLPTVPEMGFPEVRWDRVLLVVTGKGLLTAVDGPLDLPNEVISRNAPIPSTSFRSRLLCAVFALARQGHKDAVQRFEEEARRLEANADGNDFLRGTFRLRREISAAALELRRLKALLRALADGHAKLDEVDLRDESYMDDLAQDTEALYAAIDQMRDDLQSLIELHINLKSFEMNRFLRLLAVVTFLGLIPSIIGGLLGTNIEGQPFPITLGQIAFIAVMGTAIAVYLFAVKGWLK